ncbi:unnamed protein product, partial [Mesorhabditis belari]|uniref:Uncharacterized protein n=1 Tax=Mesorhabditis belari TaxID=2138241 RepID=A0AAF3FD51_9BILA
MTSVRECEVRNERLKLKSALKRYQALQRFVDFSQKLEDFCKFIDDDSLGPPFTQIEAFRLILLLKSIEIWERQMNGEMARFAWWKCEHPGEAVDRLWNEGIDQALFHLISWSFNVRFEIFATSPKMKSTRDPSPQHYTIGERRSMPIHFIQHENLFHPLYRVPDD